MPLAKSLNRVARTPNDLHGAGRAKDSKTLVLAAFFGYFLSLVKESNSPKALNICTAAHSVLKSIRQPLPEHRRRNAPMLKQLKDFQSVVR